MKRLYTHIKNIIESVTDKWTITFQRYAEDKPEQAGILLFSSRNDMQCISGELEYECMKFASEATGANEHNICSCCKGRIKSSGGYKWMYREEYYDKGVDENLWKAKK